MSIETRILRESDSDLAQPLARWTETQTAYSAAPRSGGIMLHHSLLDYIR